MFLDYRNWVVAGPLAAGGVALFLSNNSMLGIATTYASINSLLLTPMLRENYARQRALEQRLEEIRDSELRERQTREYLTLEFRNPPNGEIPYIPELRQQLRTLKDSNTFEDVMRKLNAHDQEVEQILDEGIDELAEQIRREGLSQHLIELGRRDPSIRKYIIFAAINAGYQPPKPIKPI